MRRNRYAKSLWLVALVTLTGAALAACGGSSSSNSPTATPAQTGSATTSAAPTESAGTTPEATAAASSRSAALPGDACTLLTNDEASQLAGGAVTGNTSPATTAAYQGGTTAPCAYYGDHGTGDHPVHLWVTSFADDGAAQTFMQGQTKLYQLSSQYKTVSGIGDEAIEGALGPQAAIQARVGSLVVMLSGGSSDFPAPSFSDLENAMKTIVGRL